MFDEVLPSIRKHGVYMSDSILDQVIQHPEVIYTLAQELVAEREQLEGIRKQLDAAQPKADYFDTFVIRRIAPASGIFVRKSESRRRRQCLSYWITVICTAVQAAG